MKAFRGREFRIDEATAILPRKLNPKPSKLDLGSCMDEHG